MDEKVDLCFKIQYPNLLKINMLSYLFLYYQILMYFVSKVQLK